MMQQLQVALDNMGKNIFLVSWGKSMQVYKYSLQELELSKQTS